MLQEKDSTAHVPREGAIEARRALVAEARDRAARRERAEDQRAADDVVFAEIDAMPERRDLRDIWAGAGLLVMLAIAGGLIVWARSMS